METRRSFIRKSAILCAAAGLPLTFSAPACAALPEMKTRHPKRALVLCYSQSGLTTRYGKLIACTLRDRGIRADAADMRAFEGQRLTDYDLILIGSPVFYYDIPSNVSGWLAKAPSIPGTPVAAFVSFGGPEGNQHNALCHALHLLAEKGGVPVGLGAFRSIAAYPTPGWDSANQRAGEHLPNEATYNQVRAFTGEVLARIGQGRPAPYASEMALREIVRMLPLVWFNKKAISLHTVDASQCVLCRTCVKMCPAAAIHPEQQVVDREKCLACFGCLNNCPAQAVVMEYRGKRLYGFPEYLRLRKITILEPREFQHCSI
ncbi:MAG: twin-arginine translocation signal domain-containing protein [Deltaproteobacteria bacterium]|nr:twin-arginine translocation signal domain-containing protein [Deltaproteobacteria bacterium]